MIYGGTAVLVQASMQHVVTQNPMPKSLQATAASIELDGFETDIGAVYQSLTKAFEEDQLYGFIELCKSKLLIFGVT